MVPAHDEPCQVEHVDKAPNVEVVPLLGQHEGERPEEAADGAEQQEDGVWHVVHLLEEGDDDDEGEEAPRSEDGVKVDPPRVEGGEAVEGEAVAEVQGVREALTAVDEFLNEASFTCGLLKAGMINTKTPNRKTMRSTM